MYHDEIWAVSYRRICDFFENRPDIRTVRSGEYLGDGIRIDVSALVERHIGSLTLPQTRVCISGENTESIYKIFRLNFLSTGG